MQKTGILFLFCLITGGTVISQQLYYKQFSTKDGLAGSTVYHSLQDRNGFMWFATNRGVSRFDGKTFRNYTTEDGLPGNDIIKLYLDKHNNVWFFAFSGVISVLSREKIIVFSQCKDVFSISENYQNDSIYLYAWHDRTPAILSCYSSKSSNGNWQFIEKQDTLHTSLDLTRNRILRAGTPSGYNYYFTLIDLQTNGLILTNNNLQRFYRFPNKLVYSFSMAQIVSFFSLNQSGDSLIFFNDDSIYLCTPQNFRAVLSLEQLGLKNHELYNLTNIYWENSNTLWLCAKTDGLLRITNFLSGKPEIERFFETGFCTSVTKDFEGGYWVTMHTNGIFYFPGTRFFNYGESEREARVVQTLSQGRVAAGYSDGSITLADSSGTIINSFPRLQKQNRNNRVLAIQQMLHNSLVLGTDQGIFIEKKDGAFYPLPGFPGIKGIYNNNDSIAIVAKSTGIFIINLNTGAGNRIFIPRATCVNGIGNRYLWGTLKGLYEYDNGQIRYLGDKHPLLAGTINHIAIAPDNSIWYSLPSGILVEHNRHIRYIYRENGLSGTDCRHINFENGVAWVSTDKGLNKINYSWAGDSLSFSVNTILQEDGLLSNDVHQSTVSGKYIWVATGGGVSFFEKDYHYNSSAIPKIRIGSFMTGQKELKVTDTLYLARNENNLKVELNGISYQSGSNISYRYRLLDADTSWVTSSNNVINFSSLPYGVYRFEAQIINHRGKCSELVSIIISHPVPFWKTGWFFIIIFITGGIVLALFFYLLYRSAQKKREKELQLKKKLVDMEMMALKAQMNPHFVFNCLNSIQRYILQVDVEKANFYLHKFSMLIRQILQNSTLPNITLNEEISTLDLYLQLEKLRFKDKMNYSVSIDKNINGDQVLIPPMLVQPFVENAVIHGITPLKHREGKISIQFTMQQAQLVCRVDDNGVGLSRVEKEIRSTHKSMGLVMTKDRIEALNTLNDEKIKLEIINKSEQNAAAQGTLIIITFPVIKE